MEPSSTPHTLTPKGLSGHLQVHQEKYELKSGPIAKGSLEITKQSAFILGSPLLMLFEGIKMLSEPNNGGFLSGLPQGMGALCIMATPIWGIGALLIGIPGIVLGGTATLVSGIACGVEHVGHQIHEKINSSSVQNQREAIAKKFVERMQKTLQGLAFADKFFFNEHPEELVRISLISTAFLSRNLEGKKLLVGEDILTSAKIADQDEIRIGYFDELCQIKDALKSLNLSSENNHAWNCLVKGFEELSLNPEKELTFFEEKDKQAIKILVEISEDLSTKIFKDDGFQIEWEKAKQL